MRVLVLGSSGMLGFTLFNYLNSKKNIYVAGTIKNNRTSKIKKKFPNAIISLDASNFKLIKKKINHFSPNVVINCIGIVKSEVKNYKSKYIYKINSKLPNYLNNISKKLNFRLLHISSDCVFSGIKRNYREKNIPDPIDVYGKSKLLGEFKSTKNLVIRTSIIGHEINNKRGLLEWFLKQKYSINGFNKAYFSGLTTLELSKLIYNKILFQKKLFGLYHLSGIRINKYNLLRKIKKIYKKRIKILKDNNFVIDRSLDSSKFKKKTGYRKKTWDKMIIENKINFNNYAK